MIGLNKPPTLGGAGGLEGSENHQDSLQNSQSPHKRQAPFDGLNREIAELAFRIAAAELTHAAILVAIGDDAAAWGCVDVAEARLGEGAAALREMGGAS